MDIYYVLGETPPVTFPTKTAIYVWGYNYSGQTAREDKEHNLRIPKQLRPKLFGSPAGANARWLDIACGREHTAAVASDGSLFTWGANDFGQLGDGTEKLRKYPKKVKQLQTEFLKLAKLMEPSPPGDSGFGDKIRDLIIRDCFGGPSLQIRLFAKSHVDKFMLCRCLRMVVCRLGGARVISAYAKFLDEAPEHVKITSVSCGEYHTAAISDNGEVYTWGLGSMGQLGHCSLQYGDKELLPRRVVSLDGIFVKEVACGGVHTCAVTEKGALYAWGGDISLILILIETNFRCVGEVKKLSAGGGHSAVLTDASSLKELCEFRLADCVTISNAHEIEDAALRTGSDAWHGFVKD
ncbi:hypothetical protein QQ045_001274 [Rhodiola kirilowii]